MKRIFFIILFSASTLYPSDNQTSDISPVLLAKSLPFKLAIETLKLTVPGGIHSAASGRSGSDYLFITGRTNGLHGFANNNNNFPPTQQNSTVFVINPCKNTVCSRSLLDPLSGLTARQIDSLTVTSPQSYQSGNTLYITGGYGVDSATGAFTTKDTLTAIDVSGLIHWVKNPSCSTRASHSIRQISNQLFRVTGGHMFQVGQCPTLLIFGQNYPTFYNGGLNGNYTEQIRRFNIVDNGKTLDVITLGSTIPDPNYRRRDLNIIPIIKTDSGCKIPAFVALAGVFTPSVYPGIWTVPVEITANGTPSMANPDFESTFKQGVNIYASPHIELLAQNGDIFSILFGGITFAYLEDGVVLTDSEFPFTSQISAITRSRNGEYTQAILPIEYPTILSTASNPGNRLLFGAGGKFVIAPDVPAFSNGVLNLEKIKCKTVIGYIIGGIQSTLPNTNVPSDSAASPYTFKVTLTPNCRS